MERPSVLLPLGGCPASCPDTYRLTHDHRHVRNWAKPEIGYLSLLRNIFFRLRGNFPNGSFRSLTSRARAARESERTLSFANEVCVRRASLLLGRLTRG